MSENQNPQSDKARRPRPFGSFLLFLTVLVVVLVAFGGANLKGPKPLTQDMYEWQLYTGNVELQKFKGQNEVEGKLRDETLFKSSFTGLAERESEFQQVKAVGRYLPISEDDLRQALTDGYFVPELHRHLVATQRKLDPANPEGVEHFEQEDRLYVGGVAKPSSDWRNVDSMPNLPERSSAVWFQVEQPTDLADLKNVLAAAGSASEMREFDISNGTGTIHGKADPTFGLILLTWGPWILIFAVFLLFMRQMRNQGTRRRRDELRSVARAALLEGDPHERRPSTTSPERTRRKKRCVRSSSS